MYFSYSYLFKEACTVKKKKTKISHILGTDRDILKIRKVLSSAYHDEQAEEVSRKSAKFSFAGVKGIVLSLIIPCRKGFFYY